VQLTMGHDSMLSGMLINMPPDIAHRHALRECRRLLGWV